jgi:hypothetical protein
VLEFYSTDLCVGATALQERHPCTTVVVNERGKRTVVDISAVRLTDSIRLSDKLPLSSK